MIGAKENGYEIWYLECKKYVLGRFTQGSGGRNLKI
jgi:hypothetical protein